MATKRQRMALAPTAVGEPKLSLPQFLGTLPGDTETRLVARTASLPECYLAYCYLCRTGLWDDLAPRLSSCGTLYFMCTPSPPAVNVAPLEERGVKRRKRRHETPTTAAPDEGVPAEPACAVAVDGGPNEEGGCSGEDDELPGVIVDEATDGLPQRVPTVTVPVSISNCAPSPERLHQLLALCDVEAGAPVSLALVDSDCTVIVSNIYRGMVPPPVLDTVAGEDDEEEEIPAVLEENVAGVAGDAAPVEDADADADADALLDTAVEDVMT